MLDYYYYIKKIIRYVKKLWVCKNEHKAIE